MGQYRYQFVVGSLALDFVNAVAYRAEPAKRKDNLETAEEVQRCASQAQLPDGWDSRALETWAGGDAADPGGAEALAQVGDALQDCRSRRCLSIAGAAEVRWT